MSGEQRGGKRESRFIWKLEAADTRETEKGKDGLKTNHVVAGKTSERLRIVVRTFTELNR